MNGFEKNKTWSDRFIPAIKRIVGPYLLEPAPNEWDVGRAADLTTLRARRITVACRVRRACQQKYAGDFTVRCKVPANAPTEFDKILEHGYADWMFYAIAASDAEPEWGFHCWHLLDLNVFRRCHYKGHPDIPRKHRVNGDGTEFYVYRIEDFPGGFIMGTYSDPEPLSVEF